MAWCTNINNYVSLQCWARAFHDNDYYCAVDTDNGVEAQNRLFKYNFLPRNKQKANLSRTTTILVDDYLPRYKQKYFFQNYQQLSQYRAYKDFVPINLFAQASFGDNSLLGSKS